MELRLYIPTRWQDLSAKQLLFVANLYRFNQGEADFLTRALLFLTGLRVVVGKKNTFAHKSIKKEVIIDPEEMAVMTEKCRYLLEIDEIKPLQWIRLARARHYRLYNATLEEYLMAENYYFAYVQTRETKHLDNLIAVLYRAPWHRWDAEKIQTRARRFCSLPDETKNAVFMWYVGFRTFVPRRCPTLFKPGGKSNSFNVRNYINGVIHTLNNGDITLTDRLLRSPLWYALDEMELRAKDAEEMERKMKTR